MLVLAVQAPPRKQNAGVASSVLKASTHKRVMLTNLRYVQVPYHVCFLQRRIGINNNVSFAFGVNMNAR